MSSGIQKSEFARRANTEEGATYRAREDLPRGPRQEFQRLLAGDYRCDRDRHEGAAAADQGLDLPKTHLTEEPSQLPDRVFLQVKSRRL